MNQQYNIVYNISHLVFTMCNSCSMLFCFFFLSCLCLNKNVLLCVICTLHFFYLIDRGKWHEMNKCNKQSISWDKVNDLRGSEIFKLFIQSVEFLLDLESTHNWIVSKLMKYMMMKQIQIVKENFSNLIFNNIKCCIQHSNLLCMVTNSQETLQVSMTLATMKIIEKCHIFFEYNCFTT